MNNEKIKDKIYGSIIGFALGDAFALSTEGMTPEQIKLKFGEVDDMYGGGVGNWKPGQFSDDTEMMIAIGEAAQYHTGNFAKALLQWRDSNPADVGLHIREVFNLVPHDDYYTNFEDIMLQAAKSVEGKSRGLGNGSLGRALVPIIINIFDAQCDEEKADDMQWFARQSLLTHQNPKVITTLFNYRFYMDLMKDEGNLLPQSEPTLTIGTAENTLNQALRYMGYGRSFTDALKTIAMNGGDSDSIAAIYGSLWGMRYGLKEMLKQPHAARWIVTMLVVNNRGDLLSLCRNTTNKCILKNMDEAWYKK